MSSFVYDHAKALILQAGIDFTNDDLRVLLVMTDTSADSERSAETLSDFTDVDEYDGANYSRLALDNQAVQEDNVEHRSMFIADDLTFIDLGAGSRDIQAVILFKHVSDDSDSIPISYIESDGLPAAGDGDDKDLLWNKDGVLDLRSSN